VASTSSGGGESVVVILDEEGFDEAAAHSRHQIPSVIIPTYYDIIDDNLEEFYAKAP